MNEQYGGYKVNVKKNKNEVISEVTVDYSKMDLKKLVEENTSMKEYVNSDNKLLISGIQKLYESLGAVCK